MFGLSVNVIVAVAAFSGAIGVLFLSATGVVSDIKVLEIELCNVS